MEFITKLTDNELKKVEGGGLKVGAALAIAAGVIFLIGVFDGYTRPLACHE